MSINSFGLGAYMWRRFIVLAALSLTASLSWAQSTIDAVSSSVQSGLDVIRIDLSQGLEALPTGFSIQAPARIALDFPGVSNAMGRSTVDVNQGNVKSVSVVQAGERTRVVLNLKQATTYRAEIQGKSLLVILNPVAGASVATAPAKIFAESRNRETAPIKDLDFLAQQRSRGRQSPAGPGFGGRISQIELARRFAPAHGCERFWYARQVYYQYPSGRPCSHGD